MTERSARWVAAVAASVVLLVGGAFTSLHARYGVLAEQAELSTTRLRLIESIEQALAEVRGHTALLAHQVTRDTLVRDSVETSGEGLVIAAADGVASVGEPRLPGPLLEELADEPTSARTVMGPHRALGGRWVVIVPVATPAGSPARVRWVGAVVPVDQLVATAAADLLDAGYDYELATGEQNGGQRQLIAASREIPVGAAPGEEVTALGPGWTLTVSRTATTGRPLLISSAIVIVLALGCGLVAYDLAGRSRRWRETLDQRASQLRAAERRLMDEVQQRLDIERELASASVQDALTGLPNRRYLVARIEQALGQLRRQPGGVVAVLVLSFDRLKSISDSLGHAAGDDLLMEAARRMAVGVGSLSLAFARVTGDKFGILLSALTDVESAHAAAQRLQDVLTLPFHIDQETIVTTTSIGLTCRTSGQAHADELLREADIALSRAEIQGRARIEIFDPAASEEVLSLHQLETELHRALEREEFLLFYQPIVSLETGELAGMEALVRWQHPLEGLVSPNRFIGVAEKTELIVPLNRWVLREACRQTRAWHDRLDKGRQVYVSVNLSGADLGEGDLGNYIEATLREWELPAGAVRFEITESILIENLTASADLVTRLRRLGAPLMLDDFGTGYSSLSYLNRFRVDYLKIDKAFVRRVAPDSRNGSILRAVVHLARDLKICTIAEGVETADDLPQLLELGCDYGQGFHFSRPVPADQAEAILTAARRWPLPTGARRKGRAGQRPNPPPTKPARVG